MDQILPTGLRSRGGHIARPAGPARIAIARRSSAAARDQLGTYQQAVSEYGDLVRLDVGPPLLRRSLYLVTHPDGVEQVLAGDPDGYSKNTPYYEEIAAYLGNGLLTSGGRTGDSSVVRWRPLPPPHRYLRRRHGR